MLELEQWSYIGELVASAAVVASLIYLGMQVRQSNVLSRAQTRQSMMELANDQIMLFAKDPEICISITKEAPSVQDRVKLHSWLLAAMRAREYEWFAHKDGTIDPGMFLAYSGVSAILLGTERTRKWWSLRPEGEFDPEFSKFVDQMLEGSPLTDYWESIQQP